MSVHTDASIPPSREVLVLTDATPSSTNALWRGALVAREHGASLCVLHLAGERESILQAHKALDTAGKLVQARLGVELRAEVLHRDLLAKALSAARSAQLLVIGPNRTNSLREWISGTQVERLLRLCPVPTLVVKQPAMPGRHAALGSTNEPGRYGRVLVSVDLGPQGTDLIAAAMELSRDPQTEIFYAQGANATREFAAAAHAANAGRTAMQIAQAALKEIVTSSGVESNRVVPTVAFGHAADCVLKRERAIGAQLIVIGKRRRGLLGDFFLGGVTQEVLASSAADVLVIPSSEHRARASQHPSGRG